MVGMWISFSIRGPIPRRNSLNAENVEKLLVLRPIFIAMRSFILERDPIGVTNVGSLSVGAQALLSIRALTESRYLCDSNQESYYLKTRT